MNLPPQHDLVLAACPVCGDSIVKLDHVHNCVEKLRQERRGFQLMARRVAGLIPKKHPEDCDFENAGGGCHCDQCGLEYREHPIGNELWLVVLCSGKQVKL